jgi:hypothetical protein
MRQFSVIPTISECRDHGFNLALSESVKSDHRAEIKIVIPRNESIVSDSAEAGALPQEESNAKLIKDLLGLPQDYFGGGRIHRLKGLV